MKVGTLAGLILIALGIVGLVWGGITFTKSRETVELGPIEMTAEKKETIPLPPILGGVLLVAGIAIVIGTRRAS
jgi:uncharacterized membrane protein